MREQLVIHGGASRSGSIGQRCDTLDIVRNDRFYRIMVDCGMEFLREGETGGVGPAPDFSLLQDGKQIDAVYLTHFHADHVGSVGTLCASGLLDADAKIHSSPQTAAVLPYVLQDGLRHNPTYNAFNAANVLKQLTVIEKPGEYEILPGLKVFIPQMGHAPGNGGIVIPTSSGRKGFITSDFCVHNQPVTKGALLPSESWPREWIPDEIWGTDLTYGSGPRRSFDDEMTRLIERTKSDLEAGRRVVIPAFGNGRGQNIAVSFAKAGIPVMLDGVTRNIYQIFQETRWNERDNLLPKLGENSGITVVKNEEHREELLESPGPWVVITTGGMGDFGPIVRYMEAGLPDENFRFYFTSWLAPGTNGSKLVAQAKGGKGKTIRLNMKDESKIVVPVRAGIDQFGLTAHGTLDELIVFIQDIINCRGGKILNRIVLTHGTPKSKTEGACKLAPFAKEIIWGERNTVIPL